MTDPMMPPYRRQFDDARDPYAARVALGLSAAATGGPFQPLDADLTALAALSGTNTIYYRSAADTWSTVTISAGLSFASGTLTATGGRGLFRVDRNGTNQTGLTSNAYNKVQFNHEAVDQDNWFDSATNYRYTPQLAGWYFIGLMVVGNHGSSADSTVAAIYKNGSSAAEGTYTNATCTASSSHITAIIQCNGSSDYIEGYAYIPSSAVNFAGSVNFTFMYGFLVSG